MECLPSPLKPHSDVHSRGKEFPTPQADYCPYNFQVKCDSKFPWRAFDGTCTNLAQPLWGASFQPLARFVPPAYADGKPSESCMASQTTRICFAINTD